MPTSWKRTDTPALRVHLQRAIDERASTANFGDWTYSDYEVEAIRAELEKREVAGTSQLNGVGVSEPTPAVDLACVEPESSIANDLDRIRTLIGRCFSPSRRLERSPPNGDSSAEGALALAGLRQGSKGSPDHALRRQRLL